LPALGPRSYLRGMRGKLGDHLVAMEKKDINQKEVGAFPGTITARTQHGRGKEQINHNEER